jgi:hypothetical protein
MYTHKTYVYVRIEEIDGEIVVATRGRYAYACWVFLVKGGAAISG